MDPLDKIIARVAAAPRAPARVFDFQEERDKQTIDRLHELVERQCRTGSAATLSLLEQWLHKEYDTVSQAQGSK